MIRAGKTTEINWASGSWVFIDIGFSNNSKSCGVLLGDKAPFETTFGELYQAIESQFSSNLQQINLVIEAPLSVAFDRNNNPKGRRPEKINSKPRYWYTGPGVPVMVSSMYLLQEINKSHKNENIALFEGFVSFKEKGAKSNHKEDVIKLREIVKYSNKYQSCIIKPEELTIDKTDKIFSAFAVCGNDFGIPPIIKAEG
jgi:hypothetical protein